MKFAVAITAALLLTVAALVQVSTRSLEPAESDGVEAPEPQSSRPTSRSSRLATKAAPASTCAAADEPAGATTPRTTWELGDRRTYATRCRHEIALSMTGKPAAKPREIALSGELALTVVGQDEGQIHLHAVLEHPHFTLAPAASEQAVKQALRALALPFFVTMNRDGRAEAVHFPAAVDDFVRGLVQGTVARLQVVKPANAGATWTTEETDGVGDYVTRYDRQANGSFERSKTHYVRVVTANGLVPSQAAGQYAVQDRGVVTLTPHGHLNTLEEREVLTASDAQGQAALTTVTTASARLLKTDKAMNLVGALDSAWSTLVTHPMADASRVKASEANLDRGQAGNDGFSKMQADLRALAGLANKGQERAALLGRLSARFRLTPEAARDAAQAILGGTEHHDTVKTLLGALSGAGTRESQKALADVMNAPRMGLETRMAATASLGMTPTPTGETVRALTAQFGAEEPAIRDTAALAAGNVAHQLAKDGQPSTELTNELSAQLANAKTPAEQEAWLRSIGNAGDASTLDAVRGFLDSETAGVRQAAVRALRFMPGAEADGLLGSIFGDYAQRNAGDLEAAAYAAKYRSLDTLLDPMGQALKGSADENARAAIIDTLASSKGGDQSGIRALLEWAAKNDASEANRGKATKALTPAGTIPTPVNP